MKKKKKLQKISKRIQGNEVMMKWLRMFFFKLSIVIGKIEVLDKHQWRTHFPLQIILEIAVLLQATSQKLRQIVISNSLTFLDHDGNLSRFVGLILLCIYEIPCVVHGT